MQQENKSPIQVPKSHDVNDYQVGSCRQNWEEELVAPPTPAVHLHEHVEWWTVHVLGVGALV